MRLSSVVTALLSAPLTAADPAPRPFAYDPMPEGAKLCLGTPRLVTTDCPSAVAFSPDGKWLAVGFEAWPPDAKAEIHVRELPGGKHLYTLRGHTLRVSEIRFTPDGKWLCSAGWDGVLRVWDFRKQKEERACPHKSTSGHLGLEVTPDGKFAVTSDNDGLITVRDLATFETVRSFPCGPAGRGSAFISLAPDGKSLAVTGADRRVRVVDVTTGKALDGIGGEEAREWAVRYSPAGKIVAVRTWNDVALVDVATDKELRRLERSERPLVHFAFSPDGKFLATVAADDMIRTHNWHFDRVARCAVAEIKLWDVASAKLVRSWGAHSGTTAGVAFSPDGKTLATANNDRSVRLWNVATGKEDPRFAGHAERITGLAFSPDGKTLYSASRDGTVRVWDAANGDESAVLRGHDGWVNSFDLSPDGKTLATAGADATVRLWDAEARKEVGVLSKDHGNACGVAFSPDGKTLATGNVDGRYIGKEWNYPPNSVRLWDWQAGKELRRPGGSPGASHLAFSPDGKTLVAGVYSRWYAWDAETGKLRREVDPACGLCSGVGVLPDGTVVTFGSDLYTDQRKLLPAVRGWGQDGKQLFEMGFAERHGLVSGLAASRDGKRVAAALGSDIRVWDAAGRRELAKFSGHGWYASALAFSPDGRTLASGGADGAILLWALPR